MFFRWKKKAAPVRPEEASGAKKIRIRLRDPKEFRAGAEKTLAPLLTTLRAREKAEEERRNNTPGALQLDGTVFAGVDPATGKKIFAAPADAELKMDFSAAAQYAQKMNRKKHLGHHDWQVPSGTALKLLYDNRNAGALAGTFRQTSGMDVRSNYWSSESCSNGNAICQLFTRGQQGGINSKARISVRLVRSPGELHS